MVNIHVNDNNNQIRINVPGINNTVTTESSNPNNNVSSTIGNETFYNGLAKAWAISPDLVQGIDYSSKYYAGQSANSASEAASAVEGFTTTVTEATQQAISTLETTKTTIITELGEEKTSIISDIDNESTTQISNVTSTAETYITSITETGSTQISEITSTGESYLTEIETLGTTQISDITSTATTCITDIQSEGSTQVTSVTTTGETYITNIQTEGSTQVTNITTTATTYITTMTTLKDDAQGYATAAGLSATAAATSEDNAEIWAEGTDAQVQALGGVHSAKGWAQESATGQINANWAETDPTSKAYIFNKPTKLSDFNNDSDFISGITSSDVTTALGYTPYNAKNPNGYTSNVGTVTSVNNTQPDASGNVTLTIPDTSNLANKDLSNLSSTGNAKFQAPLVSGTNIKTINNNSILGNGNLTLDGLPTQTGQSGKFLTTDGTDASWGNLPVATASTAGTVKPDNSSIKVSNDGTISAICRNVGEIISSTLPLTDAGLHLLDGSLLQYGIYKEFIDYIAELHTSNPNANYFCTETEWQTSVTTYGVCGKFVYDSTNNTVRLPKITGIIEGTTDISALGDLVEAGLPNHSHIAVIGDYWTTNQSGFASAGTYCYRPSKGKTTDASESNSIYGNSSTVQPQTIKCFVYIVIANSSKTDIQVDIDKIATDLNGKADVDLSNVSNSGTSRGASWAMPSDKYIDLTLGAAGSIYTAPADGWVIAQIYPAPAGARIQIQANNLLYGFIFVSPSNGSILRATMPVRKGQKYSVGYTAGTFNLHRFIYAQGSESEAQ